jgi:hypothetical protein
MAVKSKKSKRGRNLQNEVEASDRMRRALELRKAGVGYQQIADALGYAGPSGAYSAVDRALREVRREPAEALLRLELERLDQMMVAIAEQVREGNLKAIDRALRISERRCRLLGLDKAEKLEVDADVKHTFTLKIGDKILPVNGSKPSEDEGVVDAESVEIVEDEAGAEN